MLFTSAMFSPYASTQYTDPNTVSFKNLVTKLGEEAFFQSFTSDSWGNVKIPRLEHLPGYDPIHPEKWVDVPYQTQVVNYSSLIGIPTGGVPIDFLGDTSFTMDAYYHNFECDPWTFVDFNGTAAWMNENYHTMTYRYNASLDTPPWTTAFVSLFPLSGGGFFLYVINETSANPDSDEFPLRHIIFGSLGANGTYTTRCGVSLSYVYANVICNKNSTESRMNCAAQRMKMNNNPPYSPNYTIFSAGYPPSFICPLFPVMANGATGQHPDMSTEIEIYLGTVSIGIPVLMELGLVPIKAFQERLAMLIDSFWRATIEPSVILNGLPSPDDIPPVNLTASYIGPLPSTYVVSAGWLCIYFIANAIMLLAAIAGLILKLRSTAPDVLGYVSSLVRDSPYFPEDDEAGSTLDGAERTRLHSKLRVRLGDVQTGQQIGRIAFAPEGTVEVVQKGRQYK